MADPQTRKFVGGPYDGQSRKITTDECTAHGHGPPVTYRLVGEEMVAGGKPKVAKPKPAKPASKVAKKAAAKTGDDDES